MMLRNAVSSNFKYGPRLYFITFVNNPPSFSPLFKYFHSPTESYKFIELPAIELRESLCFTILTIILLYLFLYIHRIIQYVSFYTESYDFVKLSNKSRANFLYEITVPACFSVCSINYSRALKNYKFRRTLL